MGLRDVGAKPLVSLRNRSYFEKKKTNRRRAPFIIVIYIFFFFEMKVGVWDRRAQNRRAALRPAKISVAQEYTLRSILGV